MSKGDSIMGIFDFFRRKEEQVACSPSEPSNKLKEKTTEEKVHIKIGNAIAETININSKTVAMLHRTFIAFDVETTGLSVESDRIIELGAVRFIDGKVVDEFNTLVNPGMRIPGSATAVNHITNDMISIAPSEKEAYEKLWDFLGDAAQQKTIMCAHNANFDFRFLVNTLRRLGYDGDFYYVDTLNLSRKYIKGLENYKQETIGNYLGLTNNYAHRAASDAKICGEILCNILLELDEEINEQRRCMEKSTPSDEEIEICGYIQKLISDRCDDIGWLRFRKNSSNYVDVMCLYPVLKFKVAKKGKYIIIDKKEISNLALLQEACTESEGGKEYIRLIFDELSDLDQLAPYITKLYKDTHKSMRSYLNNGERAKKAAEECIEMLTKIESNEIEALILSAKKRVESNRAKEIDKQRAIENKQKEIDEKKQLRELKKLEAEKKSSECKKSGRAIIQMDDNGTILKEYETIALALKETGVNSKSIRDAAKGVQKHAGGFCWKYKDEEGNINTVL